MVHLTDILKTHAGMSHTRYLSMQESKPTTAADAPPAEAKAPHPSEVLHAQARAILEHAATRDRLREGRELLEAAFRKGSIAACYELAYSLLTGQNGFDIDPVAALEYINSWRNHEVREITKKGQDVTQDEFLKWVSEKFSALWRRCTAAITPDTGFALMGRTVTGYRIYHRYPGGEGPKTILVIELDDGSEVEIVNHFGDISPTGGCDGGGQERVDAYLSDVLASRLKVTLGTGSNTACSSATVVNHEFDQFRKTEALP